MHPSDPIKAIPPFQIAMLAVHSSPLGPLGTRDTGGMSVYVRELAKWLGRLGHHIDIFTYMRSQADAAEAISLAPNVRLIHLAAKGNAEMTKEQLPLQLDAVFEALETYRRKHALVYDLIHSHYWLSGVVAAMAREQWNCPHLTMFHTLARVKNSTASGENESDRRIARECWLAKAADMIVVAAARERENLIRLYKAEASKIKIIPCGVDLDLFQPLDPLVCRRKIGLPPDTPVVLFVGRFAPLKGIDALLGAIADLKKKGFDLHLMVVGGDGPEDAFSRSLTGLVGALRIGDRVSFAGRVDHKDLPIYYSACDLLALPSHYESFGLVLLEALACGTPVVATPVGAVETIIRQGINGVVVEKPTRDSVSQGIARVLQTSLGKGSDRGKVRESVTQCGWDRIAAAMVEIYIELISLYRDDAVSHEASMCSVFSN